jgi:hypothetical protein
MLVEKPHLPVDNANGTLWAKDYLLLTSNQKNITNNKKHKLDHPAFKIGRIFDTLYKRIYFLNNCVVLRKK